MPPSDFAKAHIPDLVDKLTSDEAISLISGVGFWHTHAIPRLNIPAIKVSDGPNGVRGNHFFMGTPAKCLPSATALGSSWDTELVGEMAAKLLASEAKLRAASVILAPTVNIQRSPLGGRSFESFSEDPFLSGFIAASYINGVQNNGIGCCIKHFVANDQEDDRLGCDSIVSPRALREIYLMPFMIAQKYANPWSYMTAYNLVNGTHCSENPHLLKSILRNEWKHEGMVMSDWFGVYGVSESINASLDLEMPGTDRWRTIDKVNRSLQARKITIRNVKERATKVLELVQRCAKGAPEVLDGDGHERTKESEADMALMRKVASQTIVLLKNEGALLPLKAESIKKIAIIGPNAKAAIISGGGSASLKPDFVVTPFEGIVNALPEAAQVLYKEGCRANFTLPSLDREIVTADGERGWVGSWHSHGADGWTPVEPPVKTHVVDETNIFVSVSEPKGLTERWTLRLKGFLKPREHDIDFEFGLTVAGRSKLYVDGKLVIDNWTRQRRGDAFFNFGSMEEKGVVSLKKGTKHEIEVLFCNVRGPADGDEAETVMTSGPGVRLGGAEVHDADKAMEDAVKIATEADVVVLVVGLNADWETEGYDRSTLALPGRTNELVQKVAKANAKTVVVTQSGSAIEMPWVDAVPALVHAWYLGNSTGDAIADVLFGNVNPSGKLALTFPKRLEDTPAYGHYGSQNGKVLYSEDLFVGYKHYHHRKIEPLFPFGYGLSYTTFSYSNLKLSAPTSHDSSFTLTATVDVANTGSVVGSEVVQLYVSPPPSHITNPLFALKGFSKVKDLKPGKTQNVRIVLDKYAVSFWEERYGCWKAAKGKWTVSVGSSSATLEDKATFVVEDEFEWNGL